MRVRRRMMLGRRRLLLPESEDVGNVVDAVDQVPLTHLEELRVVGASLPRCFLLLLLVSLPEPEPVLVVVSASKSEAFDVFVACRRPLRFDHLLDVDSHRVVVIGKRLLKVKEWIEISVVDIFMPPVLAYP